jgi:radical SAM superfamily enzyme YgiQ (UPF0313 family)
MIDSVLLVRPYSISKKEFPLGLLYIGTALKNRGYDVRIIDLQDDPAREEEIINIARNKPNLILGITGLALHYRWIKQFSLKLKKTSPETKIVVGGHVTPVYELILQNTGVDYVCTGEGEEMFPELIEKLNNNQSVESVLGIAYKNFEHKMVKTGFRPLIKSFIVPDYSLIDVERYLIHPTKDMFFKNSLKYRARENKDDKLGVIMFSRGCVGGCNFCYRHMPGFRQASIDWSWKHLMLLYNKYGVRYFRVDDELFVNDMEWFEAFYKRFIDSKLDILFRITGLRVDLINDDLLEKLKNMGCIAINYGIESGSQTILDNMNKRTTVRQNLNAIKKTLGHSMQAMAYTMIGFLGENKRTLKETLDMLLDSGLKREYIDIFYAVALPGTKLYKDAIKFGKIRNEEEYLISMATYVEQSKPAHERYILNFSEIEIKELVKWERNLNFLIRLKEKLRNYPSLFKFSKVIMAVILNNDYLYKILYASTRLIKKLSAVKKSNNYGK